MSDILPASGEAQQETALLAAALDYANRGWPVVPLWWPAGGRCACGWSGCDSPAKHPLCDLTPHGLLDATTRPDTLRDWWRAYPRANVGVVASMGGVWVLDCDGPLGRFALDQLEAMNSPLPLGPLAVTQSGGLHLYFDYPEGEEIGNRTKVAGVPLDVRGERTDGGELKRGYVVAPPSRGLKGAYYWGEGQAPGEAPLVPAPAWLLDWVIRRPAKQTAAQQAPRRPAVPGNRPDAVARAVAWLERADAAVSGSNGHSTAMSRIGLAVRGFGLDQGEAVAAVAAWNGRCCPPWDDRDLAHKILDALATEDPGGRRRGWLLAGDRPLAPFGTCPTRKGVAS